MIQQYSQLAASQVNAIKVSLDGPNRVVAQGTPEQDGEVLVVLMSNYPGWKLLIDGQPAPVTPSNGYLGAKMLPGPHSYVFYFLPTQYVAGAAISVITGLLMMVVLLASPLRTAIRKLRRSRSRSASPNPAL